MGGESVGAWRQLASQARAGEIYLDDENVAYLCAKACDQRISDLNQLLFSAQGVQNVSGFGDFKMGDDLVKKFLKQAMGEDNSIDRVIREHIETVKNMREVMAISFKRITGQDIENAAPIANAADQVR